jgi:hypothetical protein
MELVFEWVRLALASADGMPWLRRLFRVGYLRIFRDSTGRVYLQWNRGRFYRLPPG